jgi:hypothetical protein
VKTLFLTALVFVSLGRAQGTSGNADRLPAEPKVAPEKPVTPEKPGTPEKPVKVVVRRLESVAWNPVTAELTWQLSVWDASVSREQPVAHEGYVIHLDQAVMEFQGEARGFDTEEAQRVRSLMDLISRYAVESTVWWGRGEGQKLPDHGTPSPEDHNGPKPKPAPGGNEDQSDPAQRAIPIAGNRPPLSQSR